MKLYKTTHNHFLFAFFVICLSWCTIYVVLDTFSLWSFWGVRNMMTRFPDLHILLSAIDGHHSGIDVMRENPLCIFEIPHVYSRAWFNLHFLGFSDSNRLLIGISILIAFAGCTAYLVQGHALKSLLFLCSSALLLAIERCNNDIFIFILLFFAGYLATRKGNLSIFACHLILIFATSLKYYPIAFSIIFVFRGNSLASNFKHIAFQITFFFTWILYIRGDLIVQSSNIPDPGFAWSFGIHSFISLVNKSLNTNTISSSILILFSSVAFIYLATKFYIKGRWQNATLPNNLQHLNFLAGGTSVLLFCYIVKTNFDYRMLFFIFCIPALLNIKVEDSKNLRNLICHPIFIFILFVVSSWFETISELVVMLTIPLGIQEFKPHALYGLRASEIIINHFSFMLLSAYTISAVCRQRLSMT